MKEEPIIHSHITDCLPDEHPLAHEDVCCDSCHNSVHAGNNECMQTWFEMKDGNFCTSCFKICSVMPENIPALFPCLKEIEK